MNRHLDPEAEGGDRGAILVTVVVVMLVGFVVAATIAASVVVTVGANDVNRDRTEAFIAAESGRDVAYAALKSAYTAPVTGCSDTSFPGTDPDYVATIYFVDEDEGKPASSDGLTESCPGDERGFIVINSVGTAPDGATAEIDAVYEWLPPVDVPGGTVAYFDGTFTTTKSGFKGDLVVRESGALYWCNNSGTIDGDLYIVSGNARFSGGCTVTGSVYVNGTVQFDSSGTKVGGDIVASGSVDLASDGNSVGGSIHSGGNVVLKNTGSGGGTVGTVGVAGSGNVKAAGTVTVQEKWTISGTQQPGVAAPVFSPTMQTVYGMTTWLDMTTLNWGAAETVTGSCAKDYNPVGLLDDATTSLMIDFTSCKSGDIDIKLGGGAVTRDVVFAIPANLKMKVAITGNLTTNAGQSPQIAFVHADASLSPVDGEKQPSCGNNPQKDSFDVATGVSVAPRLMIYTPCGRTGNVGSSFSGQFYTANDGNHTISATFACVPMSWPPVFQQLGCKITSVTPGDGGATPGSPTIGELSYQTEK